MTRNPFLPTAELPAAATETHCAVVFFAGDRVYKVKKAIDLGFADFRAAATRRAVCHQEVALNRRFAPDVYLGVAEVRDEAGVPCEWIVVMRRMPAGRRLSALVRNGADVHDTLRSLARTLAAHHATAARSAAIDAEGSAIGLRRRWTDNLGELEPFRDTVLAGRLLDEIADRALRFVDGREPLLAARVAAGRIRDGHGDLLADDVFCLDDGPRVLDCLEFDDRLRWLDGLDDAACLAMDLERLGAPDLGEWFLAEFARFAGGPPSPALAHHYVAYRAVMRAKVACLRSTQGDQDAADTARQLADIGIRHLRKAEPTLVLVGGLPGTGKSTTAAAVADQLGAVLQRSDRLRKELAGQDPLTPAAADWRRGLYTPVATADTYAALLGHADQALGQGESVVLDASWSSAAGRLAARRVATARHSNLVELRCTVAPEVAVLRLGSRTGDASDADALIAHQMAAVFDSWPEARVVDTSGVPAASAAAALTVITESADTPA